MDGNRPHPSIARCRELAASLRRRMVVSRWSEDVCAAAVIVGFAALIAVVAAWFAPGMSRWAVAGGGLIVLGGIAGWMWMTARRRWSRGATAILIADGQAGLRGQLAAAAEVADSCCDHPFAAVLCSTTLQEWTASAKRVDFRRRSVGWARAAAGVGLAVAVAAALPGRGDGTRVPSGSGAEWAERLDATARDLAGGPPSPQAVRRAIEALRQAGERLRRPDLDPKSMSVEWLRLDGELRAALSALDREPWDDELKARWAEMLSRARRMLPAPEEGIAGPIEPHSGSSQPKSENGVTATAGAKAATPPTGKAGGTISAKGGGAAAVATRPAEVTPLLGDPDFRALWAKVTSVRADGQHGQPTEESPAEYGAMLNSLLR